MADNTVTTQTQSNLQKLDRIAVVTPDFTIWTGEKVLLEEDFILGEGGKLPPKSLAKPGRKAVVDPETLTIFSMWKNRAIRLLKSKGVSFLGGIALEVEEFRNMKSELDELVAEFLRSRELFLSGYQANVETWARANIGYTEGILRDAPSVDEVRRKLDAGYTVCQVKALGGDEESVNRQINGLYSTLIKDISSEAKEYRKRSLEGKNEISQHACNVLGRILEKCRSLSFLNGRIVQLVRLLENVRATLPKRGYMRGEHFLRVFSTMSILSTPETIESLLDGKIHIDGFVQQLSLPVEEAVAEVQTATPEPEPVVQEPSIPDFDIDPVLVPEAQTEVQIPEVIPPLSERELPKEATWF